MTESAYSIFKRPDLIAKGEPFLEVVNSSFQGRVHYTPNLAQEINLSRIQRQLIADKGSIRKRLDHGCARSARKFTAGRFTDAALPERRINVDRVSIDRGTAQECARFLHVLTGYPAIGNKHFDRLGDGETCWVLSCLRTTFNTDSYSRCFRYLDCFNGAIRHSKYWCSSSGQHFVGELPVQSTVRLRSHVMQQDGPPCKAVYLSSEFLPKPRTEQGGCLYEWPVVRVFSMVIAFGGLQSRRYLSGIRQKRLVNHCRGINALKWALGKDVPPITFKALWQKPGIGPMAVRKSSRTQRYNGFRPDRTAPRKTPCGWLSTNVRRKDHAGFVSMDMEVKVRPLS